MIFDDEAFAQAPHGDSNRRLPTGWEDARVAGAVSDYCRGALYRTSPLDLRRMMVREDSISCEPRRITVWRAPSGWSKRVGYPQNSVTLYGAVSGVHVEVVAQSLAAHVATL